MAQAPPYKPKIIERSHADRFADKSAHCRGIRRMHLSTDMSACEQVPGRQSSSSAHGSLLTRKPKFIEMSHADRFADKSAHCRGIRRMHLSTDMSACEQTPNEHIQVLDSMAHCERANLNLMWF